MITLDPGMAFGTGLHPSTQLCLIAVEDLVAPGDRLLDVGTGSGILAIAALKLGAGHVLGLDVEEVAVQAARTNGEANGIGRDRFPLIVGSLGPDEHYGPFDGVFANIIARIIRDLAPYLYESVRPGGWLVASGIIVEREEEVRMALEAAASSRSRAARWATGWRCAPARMGLTPPPLLARQRRGGANTGNSDIGSLSIAVRTSCIPISRDGERSGVRNADASLLRHRRRAACANTVTLTGGIAHQIARVLRLRANEEIVLIPTDGANAVEWRVRLGRSRRARCVAPSSRSGPALPEPTCAVTLCAALLKGERFDWLVQKATELGVAAIQPVITAHTIRKVGPDDAKALDRWRRIVTEAAEQSGRSRVPTIRVRRLPLVDMRRRGARAALRRARERSTTQTLAEALPAEARTLAVAHRAGRRLRRETKCSASWQTTGAIAVSLGPRILRAETAAITAVTLVLAATANLGARARTRVARDTGPIGAA